jgi:hypothetical protein
MYCGRYIRITSEDTQVYLSKQDRSNLMDLASVCIDRQVNKFCRLRDKLVEWHNKCFESKSFCTPPIANAIDFDILFDEVRYRTRHFNQSYPDD